MSWDQTLILTTVLIGFCFFLCALEYFALPYVARPLLSLPGWSYLLSTITLWFFPNTFLIWLPPISIIATSLFFTRRFNGGSDAVMFWVSLMLAISYSLLSPIPTLIVAVILFLSFLGALTYFLAGLCKLFSKPWKAGIALPWSLKQHCFEKEINLPRNKKIGSLT